jgi:ParB family chromosome partitioning protein
LAPARASQPAHLCFPADQAREADNGQCSNPDHNEGHRRLAAAVKLELKEVPYTLAADRQHDEAGQFLDMYLTNHHRKGLTALEEADALFAASTHGATKTRIRKATGLGGEGVTTALKAAAISGFARDAAAGFGDGITLDQIALLAEFEGDDEAVGRIMNEISAGHSGRHTAERIRQERAEAAEHERLVTELTAAGYAVTEEAPPNAHMLSWLLHDDGEVLTPEAHATCPGRAVYFSFYLPLEPRHYCTDPEANGHAPRYQSAPLPDLRDGAGTGEETPDTESSAGGGAPAPDPRRKLVIEGNQAWVAARTVRKRWLADNLFARRTTPKEAPPFITTQLLAMPRVLRDALTRAPGSQLFEQLTGGAIKLDAVRAWPAARLPLAQLAVIATAYEDRMDGDAGRATWRTDQPYTQCNRQEAGVYLRFLASIGYDLSPVEQSVADEVDYAGERPEAFTGPAQEETPAEPTAA